MRLDSLPGWQVTTTIPPSVRAALLLGKYKLIGGVIQAAPGTPQAGQIIGYLVPLNAPPMDFISTPYNISQLRQFSQKGELITTAQVFQLVTDMMRVAGLNVAMIAIDLPAIYQELSRFEQLKEIKKDVYQIRALLERIERAELRIAIHDLLEIDESTTIDNRHRVLDETRRTLAQMNQRSKELLENANTIERAMQIEAYFALIIVAQARCTAELGMLDVAHREIKEMVSAWKQQCQRIANDLLLGDHPERFLFSDFVQHVPISTLIEWLNFVYGEEKGVLWLDKLRSQTKPWYAKGGIKSLFSKSERGTLKRDKESIIPAMQKLVVKNNIMNGYIAQYELLKEHHVMPSQLQNEINSLGEEAAVDGIVILKPVI